ncbi:MAG: VWA domain-containing protein [Thermodesulfobacteriota bacterium]
MAAFFTNFHFLRPWLLLLLLPAGALIWYGLTLQNSRRTMQSIIAGHLLDHLVVGRKNQKKLGPLSLLALFWLSGIIALAGPSWQREASPFAKDTAGLVICLKVTPSMKAGDIQPSRLERATQKIHDLLERRGGTQTALIAYSGSAHLTMPLTMDSSIINTFSQALTPEIMPGTGDAAADGVDQAIQLLKSAGIPGSILLIADQIDQTQIEQLARFDNSPYPILIYAMAAEQWPATLAGNISAQPLNKKAMQRAADRVGGSLTLVSVDERDIDRLSGRLTSSLAASKLDQGDRWQDSGYLLVPLLVIVALFFFRKGFTVAYE